MLYVPTRLNDVSIRHKSLHLSVGMQSYAIGLVFPSPGFFGLRFTRLFLRRVFGQVETVVAVGVKCLSHLVDFNESGATALAETTAKVSYLILQVDVALLPQHTNGCRKYELGRKVFFLMNGNNTVTKVEPTLQLLLIAHGQDGR